jgi:urea transporter
MLVYALIGSAVSSLSALVILKTDYEKVKNGLCG